MLHCLQFFKRFHYKAFRNPYLGNLSRFILLPNTNSPRSEMWARWPVSCANVLCSFLTLDLSSYLEHLFYFILSVQVAPQLRYDLLWEVLPETLFLQLPITFCIILLSFSFGATRWTRDLLLYSHSCIHTLGVSCCSRHWG